MAIEQPTWVYEFEQGNASQRDLLGGKGAGLAEMTRIGLPVPPGFTITTEAYNAYYEQGEFPPGLWEEILQNLDILEQKTGKIFGDRDNPLLVSVRSGAKFSMPGMMDTVLNLGLNDATLQGLARQTNNEEFAQDAYRRFIQMYTKTVGTDVPHDPMDQLRGAVSAVFGSWMGERAKTYRAAKGIPDDLGTAVNVVAMVFGNMGEDSGTGVAFTRDPSTGEPIFYGEYLPNAQGEDVVSGARTPISITKLQEVMPDVYAQLTDIARTLESHYLDMQDVEFTVERGKLWMLQTRTGQRTAQAAVKIAYDMANEAIISEDVAVARITPSHIEQLLFPQLDAKALIEASKEGRFLTKGIPASPGGATGTVVFDADTAVSRAKEGKSVILVRPETSPDDVHGFIAAKAIVTARGGKTSHAAVVARGMGKPAVVGASEFSIDLANRNIQIGKWTIHEGDTISIDGATGDIYVGHIETVKPDITKNEPLMMILRWADEIAVLRVWANADTPEDARRARDYGAQGIGLCRTEHMFWAPERLPVVQQMILAAPLAQQWKKLEEPTSKHDQARSVFEQSLAKLLEFQREDFKGILKAMDGLPVVIRLLDPPLHEFLPRHEEVALEIKNLTPGSEREEKIALLHAIEQLQEANPMMGLRGCRLGILFPEINQMQVRAIFEAAAELKQEGYDPKPEIMIPLIAHVNELRVVQTQLESVAKTVMEEQHVDVSYKFGTMIEVPRAALTADEIAHHAEFFSFGTNDLTQMTYAFSRDDAEQKILVPYLGDEILSVSPFQTIDITGVGKLVRMAVAEGRRIRPDLEIGVCGEHGGDPASIQFFADVGLNYVSASPFRVPVARLAAAQTKVSNSSPDATK